MERKGDFAEVNPVNFIAKHEKKALLMGILGLIIYIAALVLGFIWFGWKMVLFVFLFAWANNLGMFITNIMPIQKWQVLMDMKERVEQEKNKLLTPRR
jgi:hypothetical protein